MDSITDTLRAWNKSTSERAKLQHVYIAIIVAVTVISGLITLINSDLGHSLILIAGIAVIAFLANAIVWAITRVYIVDRLDRKRSPRK